MQRFPRKFFGRKGDRQEKGGKEKKKWIEYGDNGKMVLPPVDDQTNLRNAR